MAPSELLVQLCAGLLIGFAASDGSRQKPEPAEEKATPGSFALLELFTSEGCSSCPAADALLREIEAQGDARVMVLAFHVDYWNSLGWKDAWSDARYSARQRAYAARAGSDRVYTPQLWANGQAEFVGSDRRKAASAIAASLQETPKLRLPLEIVALASGRAEVAIDRTGLEGGEEICLAVTERGLRSKVTRGENAGRELIHPSVVRTFETLPADSPLIDPIAIQLPKDLDRSMARVVAFVQERRSGRIVAATSLPLVAGARAD
ncbi:MAG: DUF1223 domain-containing protein [Candidatus Eisenbacteria bacterium]